jgi:hypothetical protein
VIFWAIGVSGNRDGGSRQATDAIEKCLPNNRPICDEWPMTAPADIEAAILALLAEAGERRTVSPTDAARRLKPGLQWHGLMPSVRRAAIKLALAGRILITRKGKPVDPNDFKGVYRLGRPRHD